MMANERTTTAERKDAASKKLQAAASKCGLTKSQALCLRPNAGEATKKACLEFAF